MELAEALLELFESGGELISSLFESGCGCGGVIAVITFILIIIIVFVLVLG